MTTTTYYNLNIAEGTDIVNPLTVDNPNYEKIDEAMHDNAVAGVTLASELTNSTIHALTRENSDCSVIRFIATSRWKAGDSVTVDGVPVLALLPSGETLPDGAYVINANVLCVLTGTNLTVYVSKSSANASDITYKETNVEEALNSLNNSMVTVTSDLSTVTGNVSTLTTNLSEVESNLAILETTTKHTIITGNLLAVGGGLVVPYPEGYSIDNIIPISVFWSLSGGWTNAGIELQLYTDNIGIVCRDPNSANAPFRLAITKASEA